MGTVIACLVTVIAFLAIALFVVGAAEENGYLVLCTLVAVLVLCIGMANGYYNIAGAEDYSFVYEIARVLR